MANRIVTHIIVKEYREFTDTVTVDEMIEVPTIIAKEVEAIVQLEDGATFSVGFSALRNNPLFEYESPRRMVQKFLLENFRFDIGL